MPSARTWTTLQYATCAVRHTEVLKVVTRLEAGSSASDPGLCAHLGTVLTQRQLSLCNVGSRSTDSFRCCLHTKQISPPPRGFHFCSRRRPGCLVLSMPLLISSLGHDPAMRSRRLDATLNNQVLDEAQLLAPQQHTQRKRSQPYHSPTTLGR